MVLVPGGVGCGSRSDAEPSVASVDFEPRLVVVADGEDLRAEEGPRVGATHGDDGWTVPDPSVVLLTVEGDDPVRIVGSRTPTGADEATPLVDTGMLLPGDEVTVAVTEPGRVELTLDGSTAAPLLVTVSAAPAGS